jgi:hypothetical protein
MMNRTAQLRLIQIGCIILVVACGIAAYFANDNSRTLWIAYQLLIGVAAFWSAVGGFTVERKLRAKQPNGGQRASTPFTRWRTANIVRLWSAASVGLWGLVLVELGGSRAIAFVLLAVSVLLLVLWNPGVVPIQE